MLGLLGVIPSLLGLGANLVREKNVGGGGWLEALARMNPNYYQNEFQRMGLKDARRQDEGARAAWANPGTWQPNPVPITPRVTDPSYGNARAQLESMPASSGEMGLRDLANVPERALSDIDPLAALKAVMNRTNLAASQLLPPDVEAQQTRMKRAISEPTDLERQKAMADIEKTKRGNLLTPEELQQQLQLRTAAARERAAALNSPFDAETIDFMAGQALTGDRSVFTNLGFGGAGQANRASLRNAITKKAAKLGYTGADLAALNAEFAGLMAGERTLGVRTSNIEMAVTEAQQLAPLALQASAAVNRTQFPSLNSIILAGERQTGDPNAVRLGIATNSLINVYARAISPTGVPTVSDKDHARELLSAAWSQGQFAAGVDQLNKELEAARKSPGQVRGAFRSAISGGKENEAPVPDAPGIMNNSDLPADAQDAIRQGADPAAVRKRLLELGGR